MNLHNVKLEVTKHSMLGINRADQDAIKELVANHTWSELECGCYKNTGRHVMCPATWKYTEAFREDCLHPETCMTAHEL